MTRVFNLHQGGRLTSQPTDQRCHSLASLKISLATRTQQQKYLIRFSDLVQLHFIIFASPSSLYSRAQKTCLEILNHLYLDKRRTLHGHCSFFPLSCRLEGCRGPCSAAERPEGGARPATWTDKRSSPPLCLPWYQQLF